MHGKQVCGNSKYYREDRLLARVQETFRLMFADVEDLIEPIMAETRELVETNQSALKAQAARLEGEIERLTALAAEPDALDAARRALNEQVAKRFAALEQTREQIKQVAESSTVNAGNLEKPVRQAFEEAKADLTKANTIPQRHEFIAKHVGPMLLTSDGTIIQAPQDGQAAGLLTVNSAPGAGDRNRPRRAAGGESPTLGRHGA